MELNDLKAYHKNPRKISDEKFEQLGATLEEFGDLGGIVVNRRTGEVIGGNQRTEWFKKEGGKIKITEEFTPQEPARTVAIGEILCNHELFRVRFVDWDEQKAERANIVANKAGGSFDYDILANSFSTDVLLASGFESHELGFANLKDNDFKRDSDKLTETMETYLGGNVKQITLFFKKEEFDSVVARLDAIMQDKGLDSHTATFLHLLNSYESNTTA